MDNYGLMPFVEFSEMSDSQLDKWEFLYERHLVALKKRLKRRSKSYILSYKESTMKTFLEDSLADIKTEIEVRTNPLYQKTG